MVENIDRAGLSSKVESQTSKSPDELKTYEKSLDKGILSFFKKAQGKKQGIQQQGAKSQVEQLHEKKQNDSQVKVELDDVALAEALKKQEPAKKGVKTARSVNLLNELSSKPDPLVDNISDALLIANNLNSNSSMSEVVLACLNFVKQNADYKGEVKGKDNWQSTNQTIKETPEGGISFEGDCEDLAIALKSLLNSTLARCGYSSAEIEESLSFVGGKTAQGDHISLAFKGADGKEYSLDIDNKLTSSVNELLTVGDRYETVLFDSTTSDFVNLDNFFAAAELTDAVKAELQVYNNTAAINKYIRGIGAGADKLSEANIRLIAMSNYSVYTRRAAITYGTGFSKDQVKTLAKGSYYNYAIAYQRHVLSAAEQKAIVLDTDYGEVNRAYMAARVDSYTFSELKDVLNTGNHRILEAVGKMEENNPFANLTDTQKREIVNSGSYINKARAYALKFVTDYSASEIKNLLRSGNSMLSNSAVENQIVNLSDADKVAIAKSSSYPEYARAKAIELIGQLELADLKSLWNDSSMGVRNAAKDFGLKALDPEDLDQFVNENQTRYAVIKAAIDSGNMSAGGLAGLQDIVLTEDLEEGLLVGVKEIALDTNADVADRAVGIQIIDDFTEEEILGFLSSSNETIYKAAADYRLYDTPITQAILLDILDDADSEYSDYVQKKVVDRFVDANDPVLFSLTDINSVINDDNTVGSYVREKMIPRLTNNENRTIMDTTTYCDDARKKAIDDLISGGASLTLANVDNVINTGGLNYRETSLVARLSNSDCKSVLLGTGYTDTARLKAITEITSVSKSDISSLITTSSSGTITNNVISTLIPKLSNSDLISLMDDTSCCDAARKKAIDLLVSKNVSLSLANIDNVINTGGLNYKEINLVAKLSNTDRKAVMKGSGYTQTARVKAIQTITSLSKADIDSFITPSSSGTLTSNVVNYLIPKLSNAELVSIRDGSYCTAAKQKAESIVGPPPPPPET